MKAKNNGFTLLSAFLLSTSCVFSQTPVIISGKFSPAIETTQLTVYKPNAGYFNVFYPDNESETTIVKGEFKVSLKLDQAGFVRILSKGMPKTYFYAEPGDTINIDFVTDTSRSTKTIYSGNNAGANNLLTRYELLNNSQTSSLNSKNLILSILQSVKSADEIFQQLDQQIKKSTQPLQNLLAERKITKSCYEAFVSETEQKMLSWAAPYLKDYFSNSKASSEAEKDKMKALTERLFDRFDPYGSTNLIATTNYSNSLIKSILRKNGILTAEKPREELWAKWDKKFGIVASEIAPLDYAPANIQMFFLGSSLLTATVFKPMTDADFNELFNVYYSKYPRSPYIPLLAAYLAENGKNKGGESAALRFRVYHFENNSSKLTEQAFLGVDTITNFQTLIKQYFRGSPVFVDFWATWCSPCIAEFRNEPKLCKFLEDNKVKVLYVSIDNMRAMENWKKMVEKYELTGYHYLVNQNVYDNLNKWFVGIPRYMLFNARGELLNNNLLRPSNGDALFQEIEELLKK